MLRRVEANWDLLIRVGLPSLFLLVDVGIRAGFGLAVADAGADLALAAVVGFFGFSFHEHHYAGAARLVQQSWYMTLASTACWVGALYSMANTDGPTAVMLSLGAGGPAFVVYVQFLRESETIRSESS